MKNKSLVIVSFAFILLLSVSIVSAGFFDWITGRAAGEGGGGGSCSGSGDNEYCNDISLESNCASPCTWNAEAVSRGGEHCINPKQPCPMRVGAGFAPVADAGTQFAIQSADATLGTANVVVKDSIGNLRTVTVSANTQTKLPTGEVLEVGAIESGGLFRRGAELNIVVVPAGEGVGASVGGVAGAVSGSCGGTTWIDRYGTTSIDNQPINSVCPIGCNPIAYELRRDYFIYNDAACSNEISQSSDHQLLQSYGANVPNFGEEAGNMDVCIQRFGINYGTIEQMYDGVLCG